MPDTKLTSTRLLHDLNDNTQTTFYLMHILKRLMIFYSDIYTKNIIMQFSEIDTPYLVDHHVLKECKLIGFLIKIISMYQVGSVQSNSYF